ncbi:hypothetical protein, partial [Mycobacterium tuberculosis]|uniref:hypothetical protein n=1 Tax=Mycobacterium tuberculosis TaxID=1773 RepID=UPI001BE01D79
MELSELTHPSIEFIQVETIQEVSNLMLVGRPELLIISEENIQKFEYTLDEFPCDVAVILSVLSTANFRKWSSEGAAYVWIKDSWIEDLRKEFKIGSVTDNNVS